MFQRAAKNGFFLRGLDLAKALLPVDEKSVGRTIQWIATTAPITPGNALSGFTFDSDLSPQALAENSSLYLTFPNTTAFIYSQGPFSDGGLGFTARPTPEPGALSLLGLGLGGLVLRRKCVRRTGIVKNNKARV